MERAIAQTATVGDEARREDLLLAAACALFAGLEIAAGAGAPHRGVALVCALAMAAALTARRRAPDAVLAVVLVALLAQTWAGVPSNAQLATVAIPVVAAYSLGAHARSRAMTIRGLVAGFALVIGVVVLDGGGGSDLGFGAVLLAGPWLAGRLVRGRTDQARRSDERAALATERAAEQARVAAEEERARIARELHDLISHTLSVVVIQAGAAERLVRTDPDQAEDAMREIQRSGRQAVGEMRSLLSLIRTADDPGRAPQPGLDQVAELVEQEQTAGRDVTLDVRGDVRPLARGLELSAYRVVQEALTNARTHAGGAPVRVRVAYLPTCLELTIVDDGHGREHGLGGGHGIVGMQERVALYGGRLEVGPAEPSGWQIRATFPDEPPT